METKGRRQLGGLRPSWMICEGVRSTMINMFIHCCVKFLQHGKPLKNRAGNSSSLSLSLSLSPCVFTAGAHTLHTVCSGSASQRIKRDTLLKYLLLPEQFSPLRPSTKAPRCAQCHQAPAWLSWIRFVPFTRRFSASTGENAMSWSWMYFLRWSWREGRRSSQKPCGQRPRPLVGAPEAESDTSWKAIFVLSGK